MDMVDRFLSMPSNCISDEAASIVDEALHDQSKFQLLTISALYISIKINEKIVLSSDLFAEMCKRAYTAKEIEDMERQLLTGLSWRCYAPTAYQAGLHVLSLILPYVDIPEVTWGFLLDEVKYQIESSVRDYYFSTQRASTVAVAAILNAISDISTEECTELLGNFLNVITECFDFDDSKQISVARIRLQTLIANVDTLPEDNHDDGDDGLDQSVKTLRVSNASSQTNAYKRDLQEGHVWHERDEQKVSKISLTKIISLRPVYSQ